jgi:hypothetical protein
VSELHTSAHGDDADLEPDRPAAADGDASPRRGERVRRPRRLGRGCLRRGDSRPPAPRPPASSAAGAAAPSPTSAATSSATVPGTTDPPTTSATADDRAQAAAQAAAQAKAAADAKAAAAARTAAAAAPAPLTAAGSGTRVFKNCAELNIDYPHGVGRSGAVDHVSGGGKGVTTFTVDDAVYAANPGRDGDNDGIACEKR